MHLTNKQKFYVYRPNDCRGLSPHIVNDHCGDKQCRTVENRFNNTGDDKSYRYLNRPHPQNANIHLIHPEIHTGSTYLPEQYYDQGCYPRYTHDRAFTNLNRDNAFSETENIDTYNRKLKEYNRKAQEEYLQYLRNRRATRHLPDYDQAYITGDALPGVYSHNYPQHPIFTSAYYQEPFKNDKKLIEGFDGSVKQTSNLHPGYHGSRNIHQYDDKLWKNKSMDTSSDVNFQALDKEQLETPQLSEEQPIEENPEDSPSQNRNLKKESKNHFINFTIIMVGFILLAMMLCIFYYLHKNSNNSIAHIEPHHLGKSKYM